MLDSLLKSVSALLIVISAFFANVWQRFEKPAPPCSEPIAYAIGTFDRRFGLSQEDFLSALADAEDIWEEPLGKQLFSYSPESAELPINLIYDYRQQVTEELGEIKGTVEENEAVYRTLETKYDRLKAEHAELKSIYEEKVEVLNAHQALYEQHVENWNKGNRRNESEFNQLEAEKRALEGEILGIKSLEWQLNRYVGEINTMVGQLNQLAKNLNLNVEQFNTIGASRGDTFAGGIYTEDASGRRIDIFEFSNHDKLVRVLAHELGHALGLEHVDDPQAIMYKFNEGDKDILTKTDLEALKTLCQIPKEN